MSTDLTTTEQRDLSRLEQAISAGIRIFHRVGKAIMEIQRRRLYRATHPTFEAYCADRWDFGRQYAYRLIAAADVVEALSPNGRQPTSERQVRPLVGLTPADQRSVWNAGTANGDRPTAARMEELAGNLLLGKSPAEKVALVRAGAQRYRDGNARDDAAERVAIIGRLCRRLARLHAGIPGVAARADRALEAYLAVIRSAA